jgi:hypothetical protein
VKWNQRFGNGVAEEGAIMKVFASIRNRPIWIIGFPDSGWRRGDPSEAGAREHYFGFDITDDGSGSILLVCFSADGRYWADTWHESLDEACRSAEEQFALRRSEWANGQDFEPLDGEQSQSVPDA